MLFSAFFPTVLSFLRRMPFLKRVLDLPAFKVRTAPPAPGAVPWGTALQQGAAGAASMAAAGACC